MLTRNRAALLLGFPAAVLLVVLLRSRGGPVVRLGGGVDWGLVPDVEWDRRIGAVDRRMALKQTAMQELIEGRRKLADVAAFFEEVDRGDPTALRGLQLFHTGKSDKERRYRQVLYWAESVLNDVPPQKGERILRRLRAELDDLLRPCPRTNPGDAGPCRSSVVTSK
jgi:hypothetical protein